MSLKFELGEKSKQKNSWSKQKIPRFSNFVFPLFHFPTFCLVFHSFSRFYFIFKLQKGDILVNNSAWITLVNQVKLVHLHSDWQYQYFTISTTYNSKGSRNLKYPMWKWQFIWSAFFLKNCLFTCLNSIEVYYPSRDYLELLF